MGSNFFKDWTPLQVAEHNARVAGKRTSPGDGGSDTRIQRPTKEELNQVFVPKSPETRLNNTEARYLLLLKSRGYHDIKVHSIRFRIAGKCYYTPEFYCYHEGRQYVWEIKGKQVWEDGIIKLKSVAVLYPAFIFVLAQWKDNQWKEQTINL